MLNTPYSAVPRCCASRTRRPCWRCARSSSPTTRSRRGCTAGGSARARRRRRCRPTAPCCASPPASGTDSAISVYDTRPPPRRAARAKATLISSEYSRPCVQHLRTRWVSTARPGRPPCPPLTLVPQEIIAIPVECNRQSRPVSDVNKISS